MSGLVVATTDSAVPTWVHEAAERLGVRLLPLEPGDVAEQLRVARPGGYLINHPDNGPYLSSDLIDAAGYLKLVTYLGQSAEPAAYTDFMDLEALRARGIPVTYAPSDTSSVAESAMALVLALELGLVPHNAARKADTPLDVRTRRGLYGSVLGIVGMGRIGRRVTALASSLGMQVGYYSRTRRREVEAEFNARFIDLPDLMLSAHYVSLHTPPGVSDGLIDAKLLARASGIGLVNTTSIPRVVDPEALLLALDRGWVAKAAIEGRYAEPYDTRLRSYGDEQVLLLPPYTSWDTEHDHRVGWTAYLETVAAVIEGRAVPYQLV